MPIAIRRGSMAECAPPRKFITILSRNTPATLFDGEARGIALPESVTEVDRSMRYFAIALCFTACASTADLPTVYVGPRFELGPEPVVAISTDARGVVLATHHALPAAGHVVRLPGDMALPGLGDAHLHLMWVAKSGETLDLSAATSAADAARRVAEHARAHPQLPVVTGQSWDQTRWPGAQFPSAVDLSPDPLGRPIVLSRVDGHAIWLDAVALAKIADVTGGSAEPGERILRGPDGAPTGVIVDPRPAITARLTPPDSDAEIRRLMVKGLSELADVGLVEAHDMATSPAELAALTAVAQAAPLPLDVVVYLDASAESLTWLEAHGPGPVYVTPDLAVAGVKLFADGALGSRGAALAEPYADEPGHLGQATPLDDLVRDATRAAKAGFDVAIHAIGDRGVGNALSALEAARAVAARPFVGRVEHAQVVAAGDVARFVAGGFVASMQPTHATSDMRWAEARLGPDRIHNAYAWQRFITAQVTLAFGTDAPVESHDPRFTLWAATRRQSPDGEPRVGWYPEEAVTFDEAVDAMSRGVAVAAQAQATRGSVAVGKTLRLTLLSGDVRANPLVAHVVGTVRGNTVRVLGATPAGAR